MGTRVEQTGEFVPGASRAGHRHLEDLADSLHRLSSAAEDLQVIVSRRNRTLLLQREFRISLHVSTAAMVAGAYPAALARASCVMAAMPRSLFISAAKNASGLELASVFTLRVASLTPRSVNLIADGSILALRCQPCLCCLMPR